MTQKVLRIKIQRFIMEAKRSRILIVMPFSFHSEEPLLEWFSILRPKWEMSKTIDDNSLDCRTFDSTKNIYVLRPGPHAIKIVDQGLQLNRDMYVLFMQNKREKKWGCQGERSSRVVCHCSNPALSLDRKLLWSAWVRGPLTLRDLKGGEREFELIAKYGKNWRKAKMEKKGPISDWENVVKGLTQK